MSDTIEEMLRKAVADAQSVGDLPPFEVEELGIERPANSSNGDWTSTLALRSSRLAHMAPAKIASAIVAFVVALAALRALIFPQIRPVFRHGHRASS